MFGLSKLAIWLIGLGLVAVLGAAFLGGPVVSFVKARWLAAEAKAETATDGKAASDATLDAERRIDRQAVDLNVTVTQARQVTGQLQEAARADPEGVNPLPDDSSARLRRHDDWLCEQRPALCAGRQGPQSAATP